MLSLHPWLIRMLCHTLLLLFACSASAAEPGKVNVGILLTDVYAINFAEKHVTAQFWVWFVHSQPSFSTKSSIELPQARRFQLLNTVHEERRGVILDQVKYEATINQAWDIVHYPFDRQTIKLAVEAADAPTDKLRFVPDTVGSKVSPDLALAGWNIEGTQVVSHDQVYHTAYGDPALNPDGPTIYSRVTFEVQMKRNGWRLLLNDFIGFFFAIALAITTLILNARRSSIAKIILNVKITMGNGALFASVGAAYVLQSRLPMTTAFTLADAIQLTAFGITFISIVVTLVVENILNIDNVVDTHGDLKQKRLNLALKFSRTALVLMVMLLIADGVMLAKAVVS